MSHRSLDVGYVTRVEGEGSIHLEIEDGCLKEARLRIFEPPRFFESLLRGRHISEAPDITARVCGICPVAYQMSAVHGVERLGMVDVGEDIALLRRLIYCGEWIESHALHVFFLHLPDFLGFHSLLEMAKSDRVFVERALNVKKVGNSLMRILGGREVHPVNVRIGGFYQWPSKAALFELLPDIKKAREIMLEMCEIFVGFSYPEVESAYNFVALRGQGEYPMCRGRVVSSSGLNISDGDFEDYIEEFQVRGSHALYARLRTGGPYLCGPLARIKHNFDFLPRSLQNLAARMGIEEGTCNPYRSILVRAVEIIFALEESSRIIGSLSLMDRSFVPFEIIEGSARAATEAPRGLLYHRYDLDESGLIKSARLIPPTSQNQLAMEEDLRIVLTHHIGESDHDIVTHAERLVRSHDPCISCAAHFLRLKISARGACSKRL